MHVSSHGARNFHRRRAELPPRIPEDTTGSGTMQDFAARPHGRGEHRYIFCVSTRCIEFLRSTTSPSVSRLQMLEAAEVFDRKFGRYHAYSKTKTATILEGSYIISCCLLCSTAASVESRPLSLLQKHRCVVDHFIWGGLGQMMPLDLLLPVRSLKQHSHLIHCISIQ